MNDLVYCALSAGIEAAKWKAEAGRLAAEVERLTKELALREAELDEATGPGSVWDRVTPDGRCANCGATGDEGAARDRYKAALDGQSEVVNALAAEVERLTKLLRRAVPLVAFCAPKDSTLADEIRKAIHG